MSVVERDAAFRQQDEEITKLRESLKHVVGAGKKFNAEAGKNGKGMITVLESLERVVVCDRKYHADSVFVEALAKFIQVEKAISDNTAKYHQEINDTLLQHVNIFIEEDIQHEFKNLKSKYDKARREYDSACAKVTNLRAKKNLDIVKLYNAEKEVVKAKAKYISALEAAVERAEDIELKKQTDLVEWVMTCAEAAKGSYGECFAMLNYIVNYLQELNHWCQEWREAFEENTAIRNKEQHSKIVEEENCAHYPLIELIKNQDLVAVMKQVSGEEGVPMPAIDINLSAHWYAVHTFLRSNYDRVSQALLLQNRRQLLIELSSALGLLEKAREVIDMSA